MGPVLLRLLLAMKLALVLDNLWQRGFREGGLFCKAKGKDGMQISADNSLNVGD